MRNDLVLSNLGFVATIAAEYRNLGMAFEDLLNEGILGLITAATRYDSSRGVKFTTCSVWWIRKSILKALGDQVPIVHVVDRRAADPEEEALRREKMARLKRCLAGLSARERTVLSARYGLAGRPVSTLRQIGNRIGVTRERVRQIETASIEKLRQRLTARERDRDVTRRRCPLPPRDAEPA